MWSYGGFSGGYVSQAAYVPDPAMYGPAYGYGYGYGYAVAPRPMGFYSGWYGFHPHWAGYMGWMQHTDYCVWHGWQQMIGGMTIGAEEQRNLLEGMLRQEHGDMNRRELNELTERILKMNKELGAGDDGRVKEVKETTTTTTITTTSNVTQQQRYDTANDFLQLLTSSGGMGFTLEQAKQKADDIRHGRQDTFVTTHLESQAAKASAAQQAIQAPPQQMQVHSPQAVQQVQQVPQQQPLPQTQQQYIYSPLPQTQATLAQNQQFMSQQIAMSPQQPMQVQSPPSMASSTQQVYASQAQPAQAQQQVYTAQQSSFSPQQQSTQLTALQSQGGSGMNQQLTTTQFSQQYQQLNANNGNMATTSTSTTTTTTDTITSSMHGMSLGSPNQFQVPCLMPQQPYASQNMQTQPRVQSSVPQNQHGQQYAQAQIQSPQVQQQPQIGYRGFGGQPPQQTANLNNSQSLQTPGTQAQTPLPIANFNNQAQYSNQVPNANLHQQLEQ